MLDWIWVRAGVSRRLLLAAGTLLSSRMFRTSERHLREVFEDLGSEAKVHLESGELAVWAAEVIRPLVKRLTVSHPRLDNAGNGSLKNVSRKVFEAARRTRADNSFKRAYESSLANTRNEVHARLSTQRKILATMRSMWLSMKPYRDDCLSEPPA